MKRFIIALASIGLLTGNHASGDSPALGAASAPEIVSARWRTVRVQVPAGFESVTLQRRSSRRGHPWETVGVQTTGASGGEVRFKMKKPLPRRMLRVTGKKPGQLPGNFFTGRTDFLPPDGVTAPLTLGTGASRSNGALELGGAVAANSVADSAGGTGAAVPRSVVESDIWKLSGDRLFLYNQYRGLQVLDVADPVHPALLGTVPLPAAGEALYDLGGGFVALLANRPLLLGWNVSQPESSEGAIVICDTSAGAPKVVATLPTQGELLESRMVGSALYIACRVADVDQEVWSYRSKIQVSGFDLSDPAHPVARNTVTLRTASDDSYAYFGAIQASSEFFLVAENTYRWDIGDTRSTVSLVDIRNPNGTVALRGRVALNGFVQDKFKLQEAGGKLNAISFYQNWDNGQRRSHTRLDNFDLANPDKPQAIGSLELGLGEQVHGTRFDGDRVYVVTFFRIDPLWIVDNSDASAPVIASELQIPGFSTYLAPLGDRLVTVGFLDSRVAVSLFDVADAGKPKLLTQLPVTEAGAWSEANWDEKAFTVLPEAGLIMLPVSAGWGGWWMNSDPAEPSGIQLVDLGRDSLALRGRIPHGFAPRRSTVHAGSVLAFSQESLLTADITDRDAPVVTNDLQLAWRTDRVWHVGNHLVQVGGRINGSDTVIAVSSDSAPEDTISSVDLGGDRLVASDVRNGYLYVVQQEVVPLGVETFAAPSMTLRVFDLTSLPRIVSAGNLRTDQVNIADPWSARLVWPQDGTLVLVHGGGGGYWRGGPIFYLGGNVAIANVAAVDDTATGAGMIAGGARIAPWYYYRTPSEKHFDQFDVTSAGSPTYSGRKTIKTKGWGQFSEAVASNGKVFITRWVSEPIFYPTPELQVAAANGVAGGDDETDVEIAPDEDPFVNRYVMHVLDYSGPDGVTVSAPINSPGELVGLRNDGRVIYTRGFDYDVQGIGIGNRSAIHASAFDGTRLHLIDAIPSTNGDALPVLDKLFAFDWKQSGGVNGEYASVAALWRLADDGRFKLLDEEKFEGYGARAFGEVIVSQSYSGYGSGLAALDFSNPAELKRIGTYRLPGWVWGDLANAAGSPTDGIWLPLGAYGVLKVELPKLKVELPK